MIGALFGIKHSIKFLDNENNRIPKKYFLETLVENNGYFNFDFSTSVCGFVIFEKKGKGMVCTCENEKLTLDYLENFNTVNVSFETHDKIIHIPTECKEVKLDKKIYINTDYLVTRIIPTAFMID